MTARLTFDAALANNRAWALGHTTRDPAHFGRLAEGQRPQFLYVGCSDSRVTAEEMIGAQPGQVFVHRNLANMLPATDLSSASVIEYAIVHLQVDHILVCGHYECGGVRAAMQPRDLGLLNPWLRTIRDVFRMHEAELHAIADEDARFRRLVELNVEEQCTNVAKTAAFQRAYLTRGAPHIHACVLDMHTGLLRDLEFPLEARLAAIRRVYDLGTAT